MTKIETFIIGTFIIFSAFLLAYAAKTIPSQVEIKSTISK